MNITDLFPYLILSSVLVFAMPRGRIMGAFSALFILLGAVYAAIAGVETIVGGNTALMPGVDPLEGIFLLAIAISGTACSLYATGYVPDHAGHKSRPQLGLHFAALIVLFYSMIGVVTAGTTYGFLFWWELMTLSSFGLILFDAQKREVLHAAVGYLILMHIGFFFLLAGFTLGGDIFFGDGYMQGLSIPVFLLFLAGFGMKAGLFPLHMWLPVAHPAAPSHVSAMMSGVMIKMGIYGIFRSVAALAPEGLYPMGLLIFALGTVTAVFGILRGAVQNDLKRLLAYSSIENIGIICMGIGFGTIGQSMGSDLIAYIGFGGALLHTLGHSNYKTLLFLGSGSVLSATHHKDMNLLGGLLKRMPITGTLFLIATMAICTVPGLIGFTSEFVLMGGMFKTISTHEVIVVSVIGIAALALVGGLTLMTFSKAFGITFLGNPRSTAARDAKEVRLSMLLAQVLPLAGVIAGPVLYAYLVLENMDILVGARYYEKPTLDVLMTIEMIAGAVLALTLMLVGLKWWLNKRSGVKTVYRPTWGCAFTAPNKKMQYTSTSYNRELQSVGSESIIDRNIKQLTEEEIFPGPHAYPTKMKKGEGDKALQTVNRYLMKWLRRLTVRLALFQTGKTNDYILHGLVLLGLILILTLSGVL